MNNSLITIIGPTAIGKTALSIALAQHFNCDIISCDSRQFFKEMKIGTAVPSDEELSSAAHHFIQNKSIFDNYMEREMPAFQTSDQIVKELTTQMADRRKRLEAVMSEWETLSQQIEESA